MRSSRPPNWANVGVDSAGASQVPKCKHEKQVAREMADVGQMVERGVRCVIGYWLASPILAELAGVKVIPISYGGVSRPTCDCN